MTNFFWSVYQLDTAPTLDSLVDVVITVHYGRTAVDGEYTAYSYGTMGCATPSETDFTVYDDLTFEQVCGWLENGLDYEAIDAGLVSSIENQINPPVVVKNLPWVPEVVAPIIEESIEDAPILEEPTPEV